MLRERLRRAVRETSGRELAVARRGALAQTATDLLAAAVTALGGLVAVREVFAGRLTLGRLTLFTAAVVGVQAALGGLLSQVADTVRSLALMNHYVDLLATPPDLADGDEPAPPLREAIRLRDVWFRYDPHEPNSSLDAAAEERRHRTLGRHRAGQTTLLVSHRLGALRDADRLVVLADGEIAQEGTHAELLAAGGGYADLFRLQAAGYVRD